MSDEPDFSAFWLYPDWDGPIKEPFWMRPLKVSPQTNFGGFPELGRPIPLEWGSLRIREFRLDKYGNEITVFRTV